ncbi:hypothetical protein C7H19_09475 [Aphanothece hegewaldii CCALA 016]|uniref:Uncharacterized protein n=1 Tax=Aphanothece hegewaldii CCALA 016 TaxID=2107694 RepID=A0A2T1LZF3_9CHRO|nr:hypothetical protein [Aphanothece hegewaldii]PSF37763.1 hypothetical protein C7H19_09475 [Aphanothece hegewaldii CCALA 016]
MLNPFELVIILGEDLESQEDLEQLMSNYYKANQATNLLIQGKISLNDFEEIIDDSGIDVEEYSQQVEENVITLAY